MSTAEIDYTARVGRMIDRMSGVKQEPSEKERPRVPVPVDRQTGSYSISKSESGVSIEGELQLQKLLNCLLDD